MRPIDLLVSAITSAPAHATRLITEFVGANDFPMVDGDNAVFFHWSPEPLDQVVLLHWVFGLESRQSFLRIPGTNAFYLPLALPHAARIEYKLELEAAGVRRWVRDALNPRRAYDPFGSNSVCVMPGYVEPRWVFPEEGSRPGHVENFTLPSEVWREDRQVTMYLPNEYKPHKRYPLLVCHDGDDYLRYAGMRVVLDNLITRHEVSPLLVAFTSGGPHRNREYGANPDQVRFLVDELLPAIRARYGVSEKPDDLGLMGASFGGVSSLFTAWSRPGTFKRLLLQSGSFVYTDVGRHQRGPLFDPIVDFVNTFKHDPGRIDARVFLSCGTFESLIWFNRSLQPLLRDAGIEVRYKESRDGHNWIGWRDQLRDGLTWLFPGHLWMVYD